MPEKPPRGIPLGHIYSSGRVNPQLPADNIRCRLEGKPRFEFVLTRLASDCDVFLKEKCRRS